MRRILIAHRLNRCFLQGATLKPFLVWSWWFLSILRCPLIVMASEQLLSYSCWLKDREDRVRQIYQRFTVAFTNLNYFYTVLLLKRFVFMWYAFPWRWIIFVRSQVCHSLMLYTCIYRAHRKYGKCFRTYFLWHSTVDLCYGHIIFIVSPNINLEPRSVFNPFVWTFSL